MKLRHDAWEQQQQRASKAKRVFDELLEGSEVQDAKAKPLVETREDKDEEIQDPLVAGLLPVAEISDKGASEAFLQSQDQDGPAGTEIDELFQRKRGKHASKTDQAMRHQTPSGSPLSKPKEVQDDVLLQETLQLIAGKAPNARKRRKKAAKARAGQKLALERI